MHEAKLRGSGGECFALLRRRRVAESCRSSAVSRSAMQRGDKRQRLLSAREARMARKCKMPV